MNRLLSSLLLVVGFISGNAFAETIELETTEGKAAEATFLQGDNDAPPLLILHGFLQTREFPTVKRLATALNESGYSVLTPTLTLGLNRRNKSLACEAIHTHNTETDTAEIKQWIDWLHKKTGKKITLIGHSAGTQTLLSYVDGHGDKTIHSAILISMSYFSQGPGSYETPDLAATARAELEKGFNPLGKYSLGYCKNYPTRAADFLSYYEWNPEKVATSAKKISNKASIIIGTGDKRLSAEWRQKLIDNGFRVISIEGANHFFDQAHEFDLLDAMESLLENS